MFLRLVPKHKNLFIKTLPLININQQISYNPVRFQQIKWIHNDPKIQNNLADKQVKIVYSEFEKSLDEKIKKIVQSELNKNIDVNKDTTKSVILIISTLGITYILCTFGIPSVVIFLILTVPLLLGS